MLDITPIENWCEKNGYESMLVTIALGYKWEAPHYETHVLEWDANSCAFIWDTDWYEGQHIVYMIGFIPIEKVRVTGIPPCSAVWHE